MSRLLYILLTVGEATVVAVEVVLSKLKFCQVKTGVFL